MTRLAQMPIRLPGKGLSLREVVGFVGILSLLCLTILQPWMTDKPQPFTGEGSPLRQLCYILVFIAAVAVSRPLSTPGHLFRVPILITAALIWCWLSLTWSVVPEIAVRRLVLTTIVIWMMFLLTNINGHDRTVLALRWTTALGLIANYVAVIGFPTFGIHQVDELTDPGLIGDWRGIMMQKNHAGALCAITILVFAIGGKDVPRLIRALVIAGATFFLVMSGSKTSMGIALFSLCLAGLFLLYNPRYRLLMVPATIIMGAAATLAIYLNWSAIIAPLYSKDAFTGRVQIWPALLDYAADYPWTGAGYGSFWNIGFGVGPIFTYSKGWVTTMAQGHNGYLDMIVAIGFPGLILVFSALVIAPIVRIFVSQSSRRSAAALWLAMLVFCAGHNFTESSLFERDSPVQVFLMIAVAGIYAVTRADRSQTVTPVVGRRTDHLASRARRRAAAP